MNDKNKNSNTQISVVDSITIGLQKEHEKAISNFFKRDNDRVMKFLSSVKYCMKSIPKLAECSRDSLFDAFMSCAEFELYPSNVSGEAYIIPYGGKAQFQLGYQGIITILYRAGLKNITSEVIYKNDEFTYEAGLEPKLIHKPKIFGDRGEAIGVYAVGILASGEKQFKVLSKEDVMKFKEFSKSKSTPSSPWNEKNDPELSMWKKTAIKQLAKFLPKNDTIFRALELDNRDSRISDAKNLVENSDLKVKNLLSNNQDQDEKDETNNKENKESSDTKNS